MASKVPVIKLVFFLIIGSITSCQGQTTSQLTEEQQLRKEIDEWMKPYRREQTADFGQWIKHVEKLEPSALEHPVYKHMDSFYQQHRQQYLRLRKADLARYKPAPELLPGYEYIPVFRSTYGNIEFETKQRFDILQNILQRVGNFRALSLADTHLGTVALRGYIIKYLIEQQGMSHEEVSHKFAFGEMTFADLIQGNKWRITFINRMYALKFDWNIENNQCDNLNTWVYTGGQQPAGWLDNTLPKANTTLQQLYYGLNAFRWALYDQADDANVGYIRQSGKLMEFYRSHRTDYNRLRNEELAKYPQIDEEYGNAFQRDVPQLRDDFLTMLEKKDNHYQISGFGAPYEINGTQILFNFYYKCMIYSGNFDKYNIAFWVGGQDVHTKKQGKDAWEIQAFYQQYMLRFQWNVATDEISNIIVRTSDTNTIPEDTKEIMVKPAESNP